jgi:hypothetical protein
MRVNIFSGGRRIAVVIGVLAACASGFFAWLASEPYLHVSYSIDGFGRAQLEEYQCSFANDGSDYINAPIRDGRSVSVTLCFKAQRASDGRMLVPYRIEPDGTMWMNVPYSPEVQARMKAYATSFAIPGSDDPKIVSLLGDMQRTQFRNAAIAVVGSAFVIWLITAIVGWIVRGFLGVPRGADFRPPVAGGEA